MEKIVIYTDGGCRGNPGIGGWGVWLRYKDIDKKLKGAELNTTNNKMELTASIRALQTLKSSMCVIMAIILSLRNIVILSLHSKLSLLLSLTLPTSDKS